MRGATLQIDQSYYSKYISIHAPRAGRDLLSILPTLVIMTFQSTRPVRGATCLKPIFQPTERFQSTRPVRGATEELVAAEDHNGFQSTRPVRGATV